jgi:hypothetical protein
LSKLAVESSYGSPVAVELLSRRQHVGLGDLTELCGLAPVFGCDFYITGIERQEHVPGGFRHGNIWSIDHHAPTPEMARRVSSTNLALEHVKAFGAAPADARVLVNHTDCDSILSAGIISGMLQPEERFGHAAIAADHTGEEDTLEDLLQGLGPRRDLALSYSCLAAFLKGDKVVDAGVKAIERRKAKRARAAEIVQEGYFQRVGRLYWAELPDRFDGEFFPPLLPEADVLMFAAPLKENPTRWAIKVRLGLHASSTLNLHDLGIQRIDPNYGGRWNAGSNTRGAGTDIPPQIYAARLVELIDSVAAVR